MRLHAVALCGILTLLPTVASAAAGLSSRERICLNGDWLLHLGGDEWEIPAQGYAFFRVPGKIGGTWHVEFNGNDNGHECGWYRLDLPVPSDWTGRRIRLEFTRVGAYAKVFLDGRLAGDHADGNTSFFVDLTPLVRPGGVHRLDVFVQGWSRFERAPREHVWPRAAGPQTGILGDVFLSAVPNLHLDDIYVMPSVRKKTLTTRVTIRNATPRLQRLTVRTELCLQNRKVLGPQTSSLRVAPEATAGLEQTRAVQDLQLWGYPPYGEPVLYHLAITISDESGADIDRCYTRFGFREFWIEGNTFYLNGKPIFLQGEQAQFYQHCLYPQNRQWLYRYFRALREANVNFVRLPHAVFDPIWAEIADEVGMLLENEPMDGVPTPSWASNLAGGQEVLGQKAEARWLDGPLQQTHMQTVRGWVREWRGAPSMVMWSTDNESGSQSAAADPANFEFQRRIKKEIFSMDPTRPVNHEGSPLSNVAKRLGVDLVPDVFNVHPYSDPITGDVENFKARFFYGGQPILIGELFNDYDQINFMPDRLRANPQDTWAKTQKFADYWYRNILAARKAGYAGTVLLSIGASCFHGFMKEGEITDGPFGRKQQKVPVRWPAFSGRDPKVDNTLDSIPWDGINWFDRAKPSCTRNHVYEKVRQAYRETNGGDLPPLPTRRSPELIAQLVHQGKPVRDACLWLIPMDDQPVSVSAVRTDGDGRAWFHMDTDGRYALEFRNGPVSERMEVRIEPGRFDPSPGYDSIQTVTMTLRNEPNIVPMGIPDGARFAEPDRIWKCVPAEADHGKTGPAPDTADSINLTTAINDEGKRSPKARECSLRVFLKDKEVTDTLKGWGGTVSHYPDVSRSSAFSLTMPAPQPGRYELVLHNALFAPDYPAKMFVGDEKEPRLVLDTNAPELGVKFSLVNHDARHVITLTAGNIQAGRVALRFEAVTWGTAIIRGITLRPKP